MTREEVIHLPTTVGSVRIIGCVDHEELIKSLKKFIDIAESGVTQQGLRWAGSFEGVSDLRYSAANPKQFKEQDFKDWAPGTEVLCNISKSLNIRDEGRVRMLMMKPRTTYSLHHDPDAWRVHIPLVTNPDAFVFVDGKMWHLPVGHAYLVKVIDHHLAINAGTENRIHVVFDYCANLA
jgi:hypothetical protein